MVTDITLTPPNKFPYGWAPPPVSDSRNFKLQCTLENGTPPPPSASVESDLPEIWMQGSLGACTAFAGLAGRWQLMQKLFREKATNSEEPTLLSFLFQYYNTRDILGTIDIDSGGTIAAAYKAMQKYGICPESDWPYEVSKFTEKPPDCAYENAKSNMLVQYFDIGSSLLNLKNCIASGYGFSFGFTVKSSFENPNGVIKTGLMTKPRHFERTLGGHAVYAVAYDDTFKTKSKHPGAFKIRNSWGEHWGDKGSFWFPYDCMDSDLTDEFFSPRLAT